MAIATIETAARAAKREHMLQYRAPQDQKESAEKKATRAMWVKRAIKASRGNAESPEKAPLLPWPKARH